MLKIVNRTISTALINKAGFIRSQAETGAATLIQLFGSALNLNIHFHMLFLYGAYLKNTNDLKFIPVKSPTSLELNTLLARISQKIIKYLEKTGGLEKDAEQPYLNLDQADESGMQPLHGSAIT